VLGEDQLHRPLEDGARRTRARGEPFVQLGHGNTEEPRQPVAAALQLLALLQNAGAHLCPTWLLDHKVAASKRRSSHPPLSFAMASARFEFDAALDRFLAPERRGRGFAFACARAATLKNAIEALGVPHTEVGEVQVNGAPATLQRAVREGDRVVVSAAGERALPAPPLLLADAHLGGLARFLRMLGFDTLHDPRLADPGIRRLALEPRIVLTRDRELLKCREIAQGCYVRALRPEAQLREVLARYRLAEHARPFTRCLHCNLPLAPIDKATLAQRVPARVLELHECFTTCSGCGRVYWPGTHYERMRAVIATFRP
jgi:uncharacterized protein with PIN domain